MPSNDTTEILIYRASIERARAALGRDGECSGAEIQRAIEQIRRHYALRTKGDVLALCILEMIHKLPSLPAPLHMQYLTNGATDGR